MIIPTKGPSPASLRLSDTRTLIELLDLLDASTAHPVKPAGSRGHHSRCLLADWTAREHPHLTRGSPYQMCRGGTGGTALTTLNMEVCVFVQTLSVVDLHAVYPLCPVFRVLFPPLAVMSLGVNPGYEPASAELPRRSSITTAHSHTPPLPTLHHRHHSEYGHHSVKVSISQ